MKYPQNSFSFAHAANLIQFPGGVATFIFWLRHHKFLSSDLRPHQACLTMGLFVNHAQDFPGPTRDQVDVMIIPRLTVKGLNYFMNKFNATDFKALDSTINNDFTA